MRYAIYRGCGCSTLHPMPLSYAKGFSPLRHSTVPLHSHIFHLVCYSVPVSIPVIPARKCHIFHILYNSIPVSEAYITPTGPKRGQKLLKYCKKCGCDIFQYLEKYVIYAICDIPRLRLLNTASNAIKLREGIKPITAIKILAQSTTS